MCLVINGYNINHLSKSKVQLSVCLLQKFDTFRCGGPEVNCQRDVSLNPTRGHSRDYFALAGEESAFAHFGVAENMAKVVFPLGLGSWRRWCSR